MAFNKYDMKCGEHRSSSGHGLEVDSYDQDNDPMSNYQLLWKDSALLPKDLAKVNATGLLDFVV